MSATAPLHRQIETETLVSAAHTHDLIAENTTLRRDLTSARVRNSTLIRALTRAASAPTVAGVIPGPDRQWDETIILSNGMRLEHRWDATDCRWRYVQAESVPTTLAAIVDAVFVRDETTVYTGLGFTSPARVGEMGVVEDIEDVG